MQADIRTYNRNNPVLIGSAGVGKTAIVEGLAQRIVAGEVPESLKDRRVVSIDLSTLMSGTGVRGSFEEKMKGLIEDLEADKDVIPFIDEIHQLLNLGKAEGSLDGANMLKPALSRQLQLAGATTLDEYRKTIEKDTALARRFQTVLVDEPNLEQTVTILRGLKPKLEVHHGVTISDAALTSAALLSSRYISDRFQPDKSLDLIDEAAASLRIRKESPPDELEAVRRTITTLSIELSSLGKDQDKVSKERREAIEVELKELQGQADEMESIWKGERERAEEIRRTREELEKGRFELEQAQRNGDFSKASELRYSTLPALEKKLPKEGEDKADGGARVTSDDVARVVSRVSSSPLQLCFVLSKYSRTLTSRSLPVSRPQLFCKEKDRNFSLSPQYSLLASKDSLPPSPRSLPPFNLVVQVSTLEIDPSLRSSSSAKLVSERRKSQRR
jgi:ATP-dependent Clp protease ATP-binding subunit ClpB